MDGDAVGAVAHEVTVEEKMKHLEFIQAVITRMNTNSFMIKGWTVVLLSAVFALAAKDADSRYLLIALFVVPSFWMLDAGYLSQERQYRELYRAACKGHVEPFEMNASPYNKGSNTWAKAATSKTMRLFYLPMFVVVILVIVWTTLLSRLTVCPGWCH